jgi:hypothetical protein
MDMKERIKILQMQREAAKDRQQLAKAAGAEASIDPDRKFSPLPAFLNESYNLELQAFLQRLTILLQSVPTSDAYQVSRKLQSEGHAKIATYLRAILQQEEASSVIRRPQSRGATVSSSRPGTAASMTLLHNSRRNLVKMAEALHSNPMAVHILREGKPRPAERDREHVTGKVSRWSSPRRSNGFLDAMTKTIVHFVHKVSVSAQQNAWHAEIVSHQEDRGTHAEGDHQTLLDTLKDHQRMKRQTFRKLDNEIQILESYYRSANGAILLETDFENDLQSMWQMDRESNHISMVSEMEMQLQKARDSIIESVAEHVQELSRIRKQIKREQTHLDEKKEISQAVLAKKDQEIELVQQNISDMHVEMERLRSEIKHMEWIAQKERDLEAQVQTVVDARKKIHAEEDAEKQRILDLELAAIEAEKARIQAEFDAENPPTKKSKKTKKGNTKKKK